MIRKHHNSVNQSIKIDRKQLQHWNTAGYPGPHSLTAASAFNGIVVHFYIVLASLLLFLILHADMMAQSNKNLYSLLRWIQIQYVLMVRWDCPDESLGQRMLNSTCDLCEPGLCVHDLFQRWVPSLF